MDKCKSVLDKYNIVSVDVPANMTNNFQPLDLTVTGVAKIFLEEKFGNWHANEIAKQLNGGAEVYSIEVKLQ